mgnify:CR=1 FL=1
MPAVARLVARAGVSSLAVLSRPLFEAVLAPNRGAKAKNAPVDPAPPDGEFTKFGICEKTAPRPTSTSPAELLECKK